MGLRVPEGARRDFVAGCLIIEDGKLLLIDHDKYGIWLPPGGHVEERETPDETAKRETLEETGFKVELKHSSGKVEDSAGGLGEYIDIPRPFNVNLHKVEEGHWHCDYLYIGEKKSEVEATHDHEHNGLKWFSKSELASEDYKIPQYIRDAGKRAIEILES